MNREINSTNAQEKSLNNALKDKSSCADDDPTFIELNDVQYEAFLKELHEPPSKEVLAKRQHLKRYELWK